MKPLHLIIKVLLITCIAILSNDLQVNAQSTSSGMANGNNYSGTKFLGWGTTSGDLPFRTNNVTRMTLKNTTGNFGIGTTTPASLFSIGSTSQFQVNSTGDLIRINNVPYSFPTAQGATNTVLRNNGSGILTWQAIPAGPVGPAGPAGPIGATGATGPTGPPGFLTNGSAAGNTPYWNGTSWITNSSNIFNNGGNVGIGTTTPSSMLSVGSASQFRVNATGNLIRINNVPYSFPTTQGAVNTVLRNNGSGTLTWQAIPAGPAGPPGPAGPAGASGSADAWLRLGNAGTVDGTNFIGTTDNVPINFRVNNEIAGRIDPAGSVFIGYQAGNTNTVVTNTGIGYQTLYSNTIGDRNTASGYQALYSNSTGVNNTASGMVALYSNTAGQQNTANGYAALFNNTTGSGNIANGQQTLFNNTTGDGNTASGVVALSANTTGYGNTAVGYAALALSGTGNNNTALGVAAGVSFDGLSNTTAIGSNAMVSADNSLVLGGTGAYAVKVGIGVPAPVAFLDIAGNVKITDGTEGPGKVLTSDADGLATWANPTGGGWSLTGNAGTVDGTNFIGTTDNVPLNFRVNNELAGRIDANLFNTFFGYQAGNSNYTGSGNTGSGFQTFYSNILGNNNTSNGYQALYSNTYGSENTANGNQALYSNTTGNRNTANGNQALFSNTEGYANTAIGSLALYFNTTGVGNTANGMQSLYSNTIGYGNTASGNGSLVYNTTGNNNTANGSAALLSNTTGNNNIASGIQSLFINSTGNNNTSIGSFALLNNDIGSNNTALGSSAFLTGDSYSNSTAIGYNTQVTASDIMRLGDVNITSIGGQVDWTTLSDKRFKKDINEKIPGLEFITKLRPVAYHLDLDAIASFLKTPDSLRVKKSEAIKSKMLQTGFIAQEVEKAAQEIGYDFSGVDKPKNENDYYGLRYGEFVVPLVKAVQEQQAIISKQAQQTASLEKQVEELKELLAKLSAQVAALPCNSISVTNKTTTEDKQSLVNK